MSHTIPSGQRFSGVIITVSDRAISGEREDRSGPLARELWSEHGVDVEEIVVVPDEVDQIRRAVRTAIAAQVDVIFTTGGTGVMTRDVTPEAVEPLVEVRLPGLEQQIVTAGLANTPLAGLSRGVVGVTSKDSRGAVIVCAPGSTGGVRDAVGVVGPLVGHLVEQLRGHSS